MTDGFWKLFGGAIIGGVVFLLATLLNHLYQNINSVRSDTNIVITEIQKELGELRSQRQVGVDNKDSINKFSGELAELQKSMAKVQEKVIALEKEVEKLRSSLEKKP